ncbi:hypothetical protein F4604DRAFT_1914771 [Suillus subluteus]|nr:hypothetical protein F4604DRAFT_1914771 [Suillus subluteus]
MAEVEMASMPDSLSSTWVVHRPSGNMLIAIQLARLSGFSPVITAAPFHKPELLSLPGATHVLPHKLSTTALKDTTAKITSYHFGF